MNKILLMDAKKENLSHLKAILGGNGFQFEFADDPQEAISAAKSVAPSIVITGTESDGFGLCCEWKKDEALKNIPILIYAAPDNNEEEGKLAVSFEAEKFHIKSFKETDQLLKFVHEIIEQSISSKSESNKQNHYELNNQRTEIDCGSNQILNTFDDLSVGLYRTSVEGEILYANKAAVRLLGFGSLEELKKRNLENEGFGDDTPRSKFKALMAKQGEVIGLESRWTRKDGSEIFVRENAKPIKDYEGNIVGYEGSIEDITIEKTAEKKIIENENRYKSLYDNATIGLYRTKPNGRLLMCNPSLIALFGYSTFEELANVKAEDIYCDPADRLRFKKIIENEGTIYGFETTIKRADGSKLFILDSAKLIKDDKGNTLYYEGVIQDVTEQKRALDSLTESEKKFRLLIEQAPDGIFRLDSNGNFILANSKTCELLGYTEEEILNANIIDTYVTEEEKKLGRERLNQLQLGEDMQFERLMKRKDGSTIPVDATVKSLADGSQAIIHDITSRKRQEYLQNAVYQISEASDKAKSIDDLYESVHGIISAIMPANNFYISLYDEENDLLNFPYFADEFGESFEPINPGKGFTAYVLRTGKPLFCNEEIERELTRRGEVERIGAPSPIWLGVPLIVDNKTFGVMVVQHYTDPNAYTKSDLHLLEYVSSQIAKAIVTQRAEDALKESERKFRRLIEQAPDGIFRLDAEGNFIVANSKACEMLGYSRKEILEVNIIDTYVTEEEKRIGRERLKHFQHGEDMQFKRLMRRKDGTTIPVEATVTGLLDGSQAIIHDITNRKRNELFQNAVYQISEASDKVKTIDELYKSVHKIIDAVIPAKNFFISLYNSEKDLLTFPYFVDEIDDPPGPVKAGKGYTAYVLRSGKSVFYDEELDKKLKENGDVETVGTDSPSWMGVPLIVENKIIGAMVVQHYTDPDAYSKRDLHFLEYVSSQIGKAIVTKKAEVELRKLSSAVKQSSAAIVITDILGHFEYVNPKFTDITGYTLEEIKGKRTNIMKSGETPVKVYKELWNTINEGKEWKGEFHNKKKNGELYWDSSRISPIRDSEGMITHFLAVKEDITAKKKIEKELIESKEKAEEMSRLKSTFLANMSHELRTPLVGILGYAEIIQHETENDEQKEMVNTIITSSNRLMNTLNSILDLSKIESEKNEIKLIPVNILDVVDQCIQSLKPDAVEKSLELTYSCDSTEVISLLDEGLLKQILNNLVSNAIKYTDKGSINILIRKELQEKSIIEISDTGIGISESDREIIFEEFRQASEGLGRQFEGTGLGLTISKRFIEIMNGEISIDSEPGKGSVFTITFPLYKEEKDSVFSKTGIGLTGTFQEEQGDEEELPRILLVEDDRITREAVKRILAKTCVLDTASNGNESITLATENSYELILMDINLGPGIDGLGAASAIRKISGYEDTPIVALTAYAMAGDKEKFLSGGCSHYLSKPFSSKDMIALIEKILQVEH